MKPRPRVEDAIPLTGPIDPKELREFMNGMSHSVDEIRTALKGDDFGQPGIVQNLNRLTNDFEDHKQRFTVRFLGRRRLSGRHLFGHLYRR